MVKRTEHRRKSSGDTPSVLALTPAIRRSAKAVVSICKRIDWDALKATQCDIVHIHFQSTETIQDASQTLLEMAAGNRKLRRAIISRIERTFRLICPPAAPAEVAGNVPVPLSNSEVEKLLNDLGASEDAANFADLCVRAWVLYKEIYREASEMRRSEANLYTALPPLPQNKVPPWLGSASELWMGLPIGLAFAEPIVRLCQRIAETNTGEATLCFQPGEEDSLRLHHRLWMECKPCSYRIPVDGFSHPICHKLQSSIDSFVPKVRAMVSACIDQVDGGELTAIAQIPDTSSIVESQPNANSHAQQSGVEILQAAKQAGPSQTDDISTVLPQEPKRAPVVINVSGHMFVTIEGKKIANIDKLNALLALSALGGNGAKELRVSTREFTILTHRTDQNLRKNWGKNARALRDLKLEINPRPFGNPHISGFLIVLDESIDVRKIKEYLMTRPERARKKAQLPRLVTD